jgi:hypothetical protein
MLRGERAALSADLDILVRGFRDQGLASATGADAEFLRFEPSPKRILAVFHDRSCAVYGPVATSWSCWSVIGRGRDLAGRLRKPFL